MSEANVTRALAIIPRTVEESASLAERLATSGLLPQSMRNKPTDVFMTILAGAELGLPPMVSIRSIHIIDAKPVLSADAMVAIVLASGKADYFHRVGETADSVTYETLRKGSKLPRSCTWTLARAKAAALDRKDNWRLHLISMLAARAKAELARDVYPDVLAGCYTDDELLPVVMRDDNGNVQDAEIVKFVDGPDVATSAPPVASVDTGTTSPDEYEAASDRLRADLDTVFAAYLATLRDAPDPVALDRAAGGPGKPPPGTDEHALATAEYKRAKAKLRKAGK